MAISEQITNRLESAFQIRKQKLTERIVAALKEAEAKTFEAVRYIDIDKLTESDSFSPYSIEDQKKLVNLLRKLAGEVENGSEYGQHGDYYVRVEGYRNNIAYLHIADPETRRIVTMYVFDFVSGKAMDVLSINPNCPFYSDKVMTKRQKDGTEVQYSNGGFAYHRSEKWITVPETDYGFDHHAEKSLLTDAHEVSWRIIATFHELGYSLKVDIPTSLVLLWKIASAWRQTEHGDEENELSRNILARGSYIERHATHFAFALSREVQKNNINVLRDVNKRVVTAIFNNSLHW